MQKEQDVVRLAKWMTEHPKIRRRICEDEYMVSPEEFIDIMELLEKNEFYEMIYVLLVRNQTNPVLEQATSRICHGKRLSRMGTDGAGGAAPGS